MANNVQNWGLFIQTTYDLDVSRIQEINVNSQEFKELLVRLYQSVNDISLALNLKDSGYYLTTEFVTGKLLFDPNNDFTKLRPIPRVTVNFGALPAAGTKSVAHGIAGINTEFKAVSIITAATNPSTTTMIPVPFTDATGNPANNLQITIDATNVNITTGGTDYSAYATTYVTFEFVRI